MSRPARTILFIHPSDELYGSDRCLLELVRGLPPEDRAIVALPRDIAYQGALSQALRASGVKLRHVNMLVLRRSLLHPRQLPTLVGRLLVGVWTLAWLIRRERVDLVHSNTLAVLCGAFAARLTGRPHLWHVHEFLGDEPGPYRSALRWLLALPRGLIIANSLAVARSLAGNSRRLRARTRVIYNGVFIDVKPRASMTVSPDGPVRIGLLGRLAPRKGIAEALQATARLLQRGHAVELLLAGGPPPDQPWRLHEYRTLARELNIEAHVRFLGEIEDAGAFLNELDILLVPSQRPEPFGLIVIEGMAAGLPVIVTRNGGGSDEIITHGEDGLYCGAQPEAIATMIAVLLGDAAWRARLASAGPVTVARRFTRSGYLTAFARAYAHLLNVAAAKG